MPCGAKLTPEEVRDETVEEDHPLDAARRVRAVRVARRPRPLEDVPQAEGRVVVDNDHEREGSQRQPAVAARGDRHAGGADQARSHVVQVFPTFVARAMTGDQMCVWWPVMKL